MMTTTVESRRDQFWRQLNAELQRHDHNPATNGDVDDVIKQTTCPKKAAELIVRARLQRNRIGS